jgi:hypothetical protein
MFDKYAICSSCYIYPQLNIMHLEIKYTYNMNIFFICKTYAHQSKKHYLIASWERFRQRRLLALNNIATTYT